MRYSIQNAFGEVYGVFQMPKTGMSSDVVAATLCEELKDVLGPNGCKPTIDRDRETGNVLDRVVVDIIPFLGQEKETIARVHEAIGALAVPPPEAH